MSVARTAAPAAGLRQWMTLASGIFGTLIFVFAMANIGMALPHMQGAFSAAPDQIAWVVTSFVVASTLTVACAGWFSSRFGRRTVFLVSIAGFTISSALCGIADNLVDEVVFRTLQGLLGAPLLPLGQAIAIDAFPRERQGLATSVWGMGAVWGTILGPLTGGYLVDNLGWQWVFLVIVPFGIVGTVMAWAFVPKSAPEIGRRFDWFGCAALSIAISAFMLLLNRGERLDWFDSQEIVIACAVAIGLFYMFLAHALTTRQPFVEPAMFKDWNYALALILVFIYGGYSLLPLFVLPLLLHDVLGYPLTTIGVLLGLRGIGVIIGLIVIARIVDRIDARVMVGMGFACLIIPQWVMSGWNQDVGWWDVMWIAALQGVGSGVAYVAISILAFSTVATQWRTEAMSFFHLLGNLGTAVGAALFFNLVARATQANHEVLRAHISPFNELLRFETWDLAERADLASLNAEVMQQAALIAYNNVFYMSAVLGLVALPLVLVLRVRRTGGGGG